MEAYKVTHFFRRVPTEQGWLTTSFITQRDGDDDFYFGLSGKKYPAESVFADMESRALQEVYRTPIEADETVFITPEQTVYIGKIIKPRSFPLKAIFKDSVGTPPNQIEAALEIQEIIKSSNKEKLIDELEVFLNIDFWQPLVITIIKTIISSRIENPEIKALGYILYKTQLKFPRKAASLLNNFDAAVNAEGVEYFDKYGRLQRLAIEIEKDSEEDELLIDFSNFHPTANNVFSH